MSESEEVTAGASRRGDGGDDGDGAEVVRTVACGGGGVVVAWVTDYRR
jgi:hypothetical protein